MKENTILVRHELDKNPTKFSENDFVNIIMQDIEVAKAKYSCYWHNGEELTYIDWSMEPWKMGTKSVSLDSKEDIKNFFIKRFKEDFNNKYFSQCIGWEIVVNQRPYFRLILSPELQAEWDADEKRLSDSVTRFYSGSTYWGD